MGGFELEARLLTVIEEGVRPALGGVAIATDGPVGAFVNVINEMAADAFVCVTIAHRRLKLLIRVATQAGSGLVAAGQREIRAAVIE